MKSLCIELPFISNWRSYEYFNFDGFIAWVINFLTLCFYVVLRSVNLDNFRGRFGCVLTTGFLFTTLQKQEGCFNPDCLPQLQFKDQKQSSCFVHALQKHDGCF